MTPNTFRKVAAVVIVGTSGALLVASPFLQFNLAIFPGVVTLRPGTEAGISGAFMNRLGATLLILGSMYVAGWAIWHRRRWGAPVFLVALPIYFLLGFLPRTNPGAIFWLSVVVLSFPFEFLLVHARKAEAYAPEPTPEPAAPSPRSGAFAALGALAATLAIALLAVAIGFFRVSHPLTLAVSIGLAVAIAVTLVLCGWRPWNRVIAVILLGAAACELAAVVALRYADLTQLPALSQIPILASGGFLYRASFGASLPVVLMGFLEGALPGAMLLLLVGIPFLMSPPRARLEGSIATRASANAVPVLFAASVVGLAIPIAIEWTAGARPAMPQRGANPERASPAPPPPPPPPRAASEGPTGLAAGGQSGAIREDVTAGERRVDRPVAAIAPAQPVAVALADLRVIQRVAPAYPATAKASGKSGVAIIEATVDRSGRVIKAWAIRGDRDDFVEAGSEALLQWRFVPHHVAGEPREVKTVVTFNFRAQ